MVERVDARGKSLDKALYKLGVDPNRYRQIYFYEQDSSTPSASLADVLESLSKYPEVDRDSLLVENVRNKTSRGSVLNVPKGSPYINSKTIYPPEFLSNDDKAYLAQARTDFSGDEYELIVLSDSPYKAERIVSSQLARILYLSPSEDVYVSLRELVTLEEYVDEGKRLIDMGYRLPAFIVRFGDLREYQQMKHRKSSDGNRDLGQKT